MTDSDDSFWIQLGLSVVVLILAIPGLVVEPGPLSEIVALGALGAIWGVDLPGGDGDGST